MNIVFLIIFTRCGIIKLKLKSRLSKYGRTSYVNTRMIMRKKKQLFRCVSTKFSGSRSNPRNYRSAKLFDAHETFERATGVYW